MSSIKHVIELSKHGRLAFQLGPKTIIGQTTSRGRRSDPVTATAR